MQPETRNRPMWSLNHLLPQLKDMLENIKIKIEEFYVHNDASQFSEALLWDTLKAFI